MVMLLEEGHVAFFGTTSEFEASNLDAVVRIAHPQSSAPSSESYISDPWSHSKKPN
jgi:hypothetical protein